jgi:arginine deiminase
VSQTIGADSETGRLRAVLVHRPGDELRRITPRTRNRLLFDCLPWVARAQQEHDVFTQVLRDRGADVLYVTELLQDVLEYTSARDEAIASVLADTALGDELRTSVRSYLESLAPEALAAVLIAGLALAELRTGRGVVYQLLDPHDFVIEPLPNLVFSRDSSVWIGDQVIVTSLAGQRRRETELLAVIYGHHPRFAGLKNVYHTGQALVDGGDVLQLAPGVAAVGVGVRTTPAGVERLAKHLLQSGLARTVLAVPMNQRGHGGHLDTACTVVDTDTVMMAPAAAFTLTAHTITARGTELRVSRSMPFLEAAAETMGIERLKVINTGLDPATGRPQAWDDGGNALAIGRRTAVCNERNVETNARLAAAGIEVIGVPGSELGSMRGGPRCMCTPVSRDPVATADSAADVGERLVCPAAKLREGAAISSAQVPVPAGQGTGPARRLEELAPAG